MKRLAIGFLAVVLAAAVSSPVFGNIVYSGSQDVRLAIGPMSPMASKIIQLGGMAEDWDDFRVDLWFDAGMMGMPGTVPMSMGSHLAIYAPGGFDGGAKGMEMGIGGILGLRRFASKLGMGDSIGGDSFFDVFVEVPLDGADGFGEGGGYIGLRTPMGQHGWVHIKSQSKIGTENHSVVFDEWAYEDQPGVPIAAGQGKTCDWVPGRPYKMHWPQLPDLGSTGIDVSLSRTPLADDFVCTATGAIRDIHIWGSFQEDVLPKDGPESLTLQLSIYSDIPATKDRWSRPGNLMWTRTFKPGEYSARKVHDGPEDWYEPVAGLYAPANHRQAFQYNFCIDRDTFVQQQGTVYWLVVDDLSTNVDYMFGWKTTPPRYHWNDDAVYQMSSKLGWMAMTYPKGHRYEGRTMDLAFVITGDDTTAPQYDLGDAPDSSNSFPGVTMLAYPGTNGSFPTVYQAGSPPFGPLHRHPRDMFFLGKRVSLETEADIGPDEDGLNNIGPAAFPGLRTFPGLRFPGLEKFPQAGDYILPYMESDRDGADDGLHQPVVYFPATGNGQMTVDYDVTCTSPQPTRAYVNIWLDFNRDGDWDDLLSAPDGAAESEWAVRNQVLSFPSPGEYTFTSPPFACSHLLTAEADPLWVRITIAEEQHFPPILTSGTLLGLEGAGPAAGYEYGETEDYLIRPLIGAIALKFDWGDAPETAAAGGYPTSLASNGARHVPVGPWLGDDTDMPDSELDGRPDAHALGDDNDPAGAADDEDGVSIPPLVQGQLAVATIEVNGGGGVVQAWIDFNGDKAWQATESIFDGFLPDGVCAIPFSVPNAAVVGQTFARFRISSKGDLGPVGVAPDGEVEDHEVSIASPPTDAKTWCQPPDLTPQGIDIRVDNSDGKARALADDFGCKTPGQLTHIRLWGSWKADHKGQIKKIHVAIQPDDPAGLEGADKKNLFSKPGPETLWEKEFLPGQFEETLHHVVGDKGEWWWDPLSDKAEPGGDTQVWQIDMKVESKDAFKQEGTAAKPLIYWLVVRVETADGEFGWKTRQWPEHFMDDAVSNVAPASPATWNELRYPPEHPYYDSERNSIDLAFCLMFSTETSPPTIMPGAITTCPPVATRCRIIETECPATATKCPITETQCPVTDTKCPPAETKCPVAFTVCPPSSTRCPPAVTQCSPTKCPVATQCPAVETQCPPVDTQCGWRETECPVTPTACPIVLTQCPTPQTSCPVVPTQCPPVDTQCGWRETECPVTATACPIILTHCPTPETSCPAEATKCPPAETKCPEWLTKCPPTATKCRQVQTECPPVQTNCPPVDTRCPPTSPTKCPESLTKCPESLTKCPEAKTKCPPVETQCPVVNTQCPTVETECPAGKTWCPPILTLCPKTVTKCTGCIGGTLGSAIDTGVPDDACPIVEAACPTIDEYAALAQAAW